MQYHDMQAIQMPPVCHTIHPHYPWISKASKLIYEAELDTPWMMRSIWLRRRSTQNPLDTSIEPYHLTMATPMHRRTGSFTIAKHHGAVHGCILTSVPIGFIQKEFGMGINLVRSPGTKRRMPHGIHCGGEYYGPDYDSYCMKQSLVDTVGLASPFIVPSCVPASRPCW